MTPDHWQQATLGDFMEFKNGINTDKSNYGHGTKFVNVMDIFENDYLYANNVIGSVNITEKQRNEYSVCRGDVLFNRTSETFDEIAMSAVYLGTEEITFGGFVIRGRPTTNELVSEYLIYCLKTSSSRKEFIRRGQGAVRANIGQKDLCKVPMLIPPRKNKPKSPKSYQPGTRPLPPPKS